MRSRREFLLGFSATVAALALAPARSVGRRAISPRSFKSLAGMSYEMLAGQVNTRFRVRLSPVRVVELKLLKAPLARPTPSIPGRRPPGDARNEKFSLIFSGPQEALLASAIHRFEHDQLGRFEMYIGPIGAQDTDWIRYEAVFNQPAATGASGATLT